MDTEKQTHDLWSRRRFLQNTATTIAGGTLLAACGTTTENMIFPGTLSRFDIPHPDQTQATIDAAKGKTFFPSGNLYIPDAYTAPLPLYQTVSKPPGDGSIVRAFGMSFLTAPIARSQNRYWQELERRLNVVWQPTLSVYNDYATKGNITLLGSNAPELFLVTAEASIQRALLQGAFNDLTPYLEGEKLKEYPNLSLIPPVSWEEGKIGGKIWGVPRPRSILGSVFMYRQDWAAKVGFEQQPQNPDEFFKLLEACSMFDSAGNKSNNNTWGIGNRMVNITLILGMFDVPLAWKKEQDGSFTYFIETDEFRQALDYHRRLFAAGLFHPDAASMTNQNAKKDFYAGKFLGWEAGYNGLVDVRLSAKKVNPDADVRMMIPKNNQGKARAIWGAAHYGITGIPVQNTTNPDKIKMLLRILDYLVAPAFSVENTFLTTGIEGWDCKVEKNGVRKHTDRGKQEIGEVVSAVSNPPPYFYVASDPSYGPYMQDAARQYHESGSSDPSTGLISPTLRKQNATLLALVNGELARIIRGEASMSALDGLIAQWKARGGDKIKQEFAESAAQLG